MQYMEQDRVIEPVLVEQAGFYAIVKFGDQYYPFTAKTKHHELLLLSEEELQKVIKAPTLELARLLAFQNA